MDITLRNTTYDLTPVCSVYGDGSTALVLDNKWDGEHFATVSVWLGVAPAEGCIWVKNYSENAGMLLALTAAGVLEATGRFTLSGFVSIPEARIL